METASVEKPHAMPVGVPAGRKSFVRGMFDDISPSYDFLNHLLSAGMDKRWRRQTVRSLSRLLKAGHPAVLDVATGTGDLAIALLRLNPSRITGVDISDRMLERGRKKLRERGLEKRIELIYGDAGNLPFPPESFDAVTAAFGVRNFEDAEKGLREMHRVLKKDGVIAILEFSRQPNKFIQKLFDIYFSGLLPRIGRMVSGHREAYRYLPASVSGFYGREAFAALLERAGFGGIQIKILSLGICSLFLGRK